MKSRSPLTPDQALRLWSQLRFVHISGCAGPRYDADATDRTCSPRLCSCNCHLAHRVHARLVDEATR